MQRAVKLLVVSWDVIRKDPISNTIQCLYELEAPMGLFEDFKASDQRDMIYGLIPLAKDVYDSQECLPDFSRRYRHIGTKLAKFSMRTIGFLNIV